MLRTVVAGILFPQPHLLLLCAATIVSAGCSPPPQHYSSKRIAKIQYVDPPYALATAKRRAHSARPLWKLEEPRSDPLTHVGSEQFEASGTYLLITDPFRVVDKRTGKVIGQNPDFVDQVALLPGGDAVVTDRHSDIVRIRVPSGREVWLTKSPCARPPPPPAGHSEWKVLPTAAQLARWRAEGEAADVSLLVVSGRDIFVGCTNPRIARLDARTGKVLASRDVAPVERYVKIALITGNALLAEGVSSGAMLQNWVALVRRESLAAIAPPRHQTQFVGLSGSTAVLDDLCCFGRGADYRPATIYTVNLMNGIVTSPVDLRPDPEQHRDSRTFAFQGWNQSTVVHGHLLLAVPPILYDYGDPRRLRNEPLRLMRGLEDLRMIRDGIAFATVKLRGELWVGEVVDLVARPVRVRRTFEFWQEPAVDDEPSDGPVFVISRGLGSTASSFDAIRISDGATVKLPCSLRTAGDTQLFVGCSSFGFGTPRSWIEALDFPPRRKH